MNSKLKNSRRLSSFEAVLSLENKDRVFLISFEDVCTINELLSLAQRI